MEWIKTTDSEILFGYIIRIKMTEANLSVSKAAEIAGLKIDVLGSFLRNEIYINNIPIKLIERLFRRLDLKLSDEVKSSILFSCRKLKQWETDNNVPKKGWNELWENDEAWNKYIKRLEELLN